MFGIGVVVLYNRIIKETSQYREAEMTGARTLCYQLHSNGV